MALQTSGSLGFSEIVSEFGGANSHSLSEYYPLVGQGVTGLPSSGAISFSDFRGKDKDVITSTWVTSSSSVMNITIQAHIFGMGLQQPRGGGRVITLVL